MTEKKVMTFEQTIKSRRSTRNFSKKIPPIDELNKIIKSCIYAPYGGATGIPLNEIKKVFIFKQNTYSFTKAREILLMQIRKNSKKINTMLTLFPFLKKKFKPFAKRLNTISQNGIPSLMEAPYFIIVSEKKGFPPIEKQSIAHAMQNMWLTATNLGLGFQMISASGLMSGNKQFLKLLGLKKGEFALDGCVIGYPINVSDKNIDFDIKQFVNWIE